MRLTMLPLLAVVATLSLGCTSARYTIDGDEVRLRVGMGGFVDPILARYDGWAAEGKRVVIDGQMVSADAFGAFGSPGACYTENAIFSPHAASVLGVIPDYTLTDRLAARLPEPLEAWFRGDVAYWDWIGFAQVGFPELIEIWPEGACVDDVEAALALWRARDAARLRALEEQGQR